MAFPRLSPKETEKYKPSTENINVSKLLFCGDINLIVSMISQPPFFFNRIRASHKGLKIICKQISALALKIFCRMEIFETCVMSVIALILFKSVVAEGIIALISHLRQRSATLNSMNS